jgi:hypothetical protein
MPLIFLKRIPSKLEAALRALHENDAEAFTRALGRATRLEAGAREVFGNACKVNRPVYLPEVASLQSMISTALDDVRVCIFAISSTLGRDPELEYIKIEEKDCTSQRPFDLNDKQCVEAVDSMLANLVSYLRAHIRDRK